MVALGTSESKQPLFENRIAAIPERQREAKPALAIANAQQTIFTPAIGSTASLVVRELLPGIAVLGVIFPDRSPLSLGQIRPPALPVALARPAFVEPLRFCIAHSNNPDSKAAATCPPQRWRWELAELRPRQFCIGNHRAANVKTSNPGRFAPPDKDRSTLATMFIL